MKRFVNPRREYGERVKEVPPPLDVEQDDQENDRPQQSPISVAQFFDGGDTVRTGAAKARRDARRADGRIYFAAVFRAVGVGVGHRVLQYQC